jgi:hypothetical protein
MLCSCAVGRCSPLGQPFGRRFFLPVPAMVLAATPEVIRVPSTVASLRLALKVSLTLLGQAPMMWGLRQHRLD